MNSTQNRLLALHQLVAMQGDELEALEESLIRGSTDTKFVTRLQGVQMELTKAALAAKNILIVTQANNSIKGGADADLRKETRESD